MNEMSALLISRMKQVCLFAAFYIWSDAHQHCHHVVKLLLLGVHQAT